MRKKKDQNLCIGGRIRYSRKTAGITQERLAGMINVSTQYVSDLERGIVGTSVTTLIKICMTLHVSSDYILMNRQFPISMSPEYRRLEYLNEEQKALVTRGINVLIDAMEEK